MNIYFEKEIISLKINILKLVCSKNKKAPRNRAFDLGCLQ